MTTILAYIGAAAAEIAGCLLLGMAAARQVAVMDRARASAR